MKIAVIDLETTGLHPHVHEIIEVGGVIFDDRTYDIVDTLDFKVTPTNMDVFSEQARIVNGYTEEAWKDAMSKEEAVRELRLRANNAVFCSYPLLFDYSFIQAAGAHVNFNRYKTCLFSMMYSHFGTFMSLKDACRRFDIPPEPDVHRAINGAMAGYELYKALHSHD